MTETAQKAPQQERSRKTEQMLLDALEKLLRDKSIHELTVAEISREAGVTTGAIYRRFKDKRAMLQAAFERFLSRTTEQGEEGHVFESDTDREILSGIIMGTLIFTLDHIPLMKAAANYEDLVSFDQMRTARNLSADRLSASLRQSELGDEERQKRARFVMRTVTAVIRDTFMTGPAAKGTGLSTSDFIKANQSRIDLLINDLTEMAASYLLIKS